MQPFISKTINGKAIGLTNEKIKCPFCGGKLIGTGVICKCELYTDTEGCENNSRDLTN